jgi:hypothetical protein
VVNAQRAVGTRSRNAHHAYARIVAPISHPPKMTGPYGPRTMVIGVLAVSPAGSAPPSQPTTASRTAAPNPIHRSRTGRC